MGLYQRGDPYKILAKEKYGFYLTNFCYCWNVGSLQCDIKESAPTTSRDLVVTFFESVNVVVKQFHCLLSNPYFSFG